MLQHQVGMATRVELERFESLIDENAILARELAAVQRRTMRQTAAFAQRVDELEGELMRGRAQRAAGQTQMAQLQEQLAALQRATPHLDEHQVLAQEALHLREQVRALQRTLAAAQEQLLRQRSRTEAAEQRLLLAPQPPAASAAAATAPER